MLLAPKLTKRLLCTVENFGDGQLPATYPNDAFFKTMFSEPERAIAFLKSHLPATIAARVDWPTLKVLPTTFVKSSLQQLQSDLVFSLKIGNRDALLYVLFEHQSTVDPTMPLRLLSYVTEILVKHQKTYGLPLPPVLPFVFHQGPQTWNVSTAFSDLFELSDDLAVDLLPFLPAFRHALLDLTLYDPAQDEGDNQLRIILQLMKLAREQKLMQYFQWLAETMVVLVPDSLLGPLLFYALQSDSDLDVNNIYHTLSSNPELQKNVMSVAEQLRAEGRVEGLEKGQEKGLLIGKIQMLEDFLGLPIRSHEILGPMTTQQLEAAHRQLHREYEVRFKRS